MSLWDKIKNIKFTKVVIILMFVELTVFTAVMIDLFYKTGSVPDILITCVFAFTSAEGGALALIKTCKVKNIERYSNVEEPTDNLDEEE